MRKAVWSTADPDACGPEKYAEQLLGDRDGRGLVGQHDVDHAVGRLHPRSGRRRRGATSPRPPPAIIAGPPIPMEVSSVATIRSEQPAMTALPAKHRPLTTAIRGTSPGQRRPQREGAHVERRDHRVVGVAGPAATALGEEHRREPHPLDELEQPVLLAVAERALRARQDRVVVGQHRAGASPSTRRRRRPPVHRRGCARSGRRRRVAGVARRSRTCRTRRRIRRRRGRRRSPGRSARHRRACARRRRAGPRPRSGPVGAAARRGLPAAVRQSASRPFWNSVSAVTCCHEA